MKDYETLIADIRREERDLNDKLTNLEFFMMTEDFTQISPEQKRLLERQHDLMAQYKTVLIQRAHRINYEHANRTTEEKLKEYAEKRAELKVINCASCRHYKKDTCTHGVLNGADCWEKRTILDGPEKLENKCGNCKWYGEGHDGYACQNVPAERENMPCFQERD
ncbi:MAG: hypothetical protein IKY09_02660 [Methanocorpusculum sp.]|nr:hypothetical protein [Methanocorpusculum sp.]MBR5451038.1 hypothetical protein [Methanocorpusculum sp.]